MVMARWTSICLVVLLIGSARDVYASSDVQSAHQLPTDSAFVSLASAAGLSEVASGREASSKGQSAAVRSFGQTMVIDHTHANLILKQLADAKGIITAMTPTADQQASIDALKLLSGPAFDKRYAAQAVKDHEGAIALFEHEATSGKDADLRAFAVQTLPTLQHHLAMAKSLPGN